MGDATPIWLVTNDASKSNDSVALQSLRDCCDQHRFSVLRHTTFLNAALPGAADLDDAGIAILVIFAGDGTVNAALDAVEGWNGKVLVLPGGTMNLLYHRLFGALDMFQAIEAAGCGNASARRPGMLRSCCGNAYAGVLAGPGAAWGNAREAMRDGQPLDIVSDAAGALAETVSGDPVVCADPPLGRKEGYPLILLTPHDEYMELVAHHAASAGEFVEQLAAVLKRDFRNGPHDTIGQEQHAVLRSVHGSPLNVLLDGEQCKAGGQTHFKLERCRVDLLATITHD